MINGIQAGGSTNIKDALKLALSILNSRKQINEVSSIFLLSDGCDELSRVWLKEYFKGKDYMKQLDSISINTFGFGEDDFVLLETIADKTSGMFYDTQEYSDCMDCFAECLGGLLSIIGKNVTIDIDLKPVSDHIIKKIHFSQPDSWSEEIISVSDSKIQIKYQYMFSGMSRNFYFSIGYSCHPVTSAVAALRTIKLLDANISVQSTTTSEMAVKTATLEVR